MTHPSNKILKFKFPLNFLVTLLDSTELFISTWLWNVCNHEAVRICNSIPDFFAIFIIKEEVEQEKYSSLQRAS